MSRKYRKRQALMILVVTFSAMPSLWKLLIVLPNLINLVIEYYEFDYEWTYDTRKRNAPIRK